MSVILSSLIIASSLAMMVCLLFRVLRFRESENHRAGIMVWVFLLEILIVSADLWAGGDVLERIILDIIVTLIPLMAIMSSLWLKEISVRMVYTGMVMQACLAVYYALVASGIVSMMPYMALRRCIFFASVCPPLVYMLSVVFRVRDVKAVMKSGTVWCGLCLAVESLYVASLVVSVSVFMSFSPDNAPGFVTAVTVFLLCGESVAIALRAIFDSLFVLWHRQERRIVESMKVSHVEISNDSVKDEHQYQDIYERVTAYFENERPYLNSELTIHDIVKVVFTNKLYISRAISQYTGRNFRQFVNFYRVTHSVNLFRSNPDMKVVELANASGFNSVVSFTMAFRLFMNENPSDWCRHERSRLIKRKNKLWNR